MKIIVAGKSKEVADGLSLAELIQKEEVENPEYVTVTINNDFIEGEAFGKVLLKEGDIVEFLYFMGGGCI